MNKIFSSKLILPFSVVAVALIIVIGAAFILNQDSEPQPTASPSPSPTPLVKVPEDWQTYRNAEFEFEVKYPKNFVVTRDQSIGIENPQQAIAIAQKTQESYFTDITIVGFHDWKGTLDEYINHLNGLLLGECYRTEVDTRECLRRWGWKNPAEMMVDGVRALKFESIGVTPVVIHAQYRNFVYTFSFGGGDITIFDQIISTFKFNE